MVLCKQRFEGDRPYFDVGYFLWMAVPGSSGLLDRMADIAEPAAEDGRALKGTPLFAVAKLAPLGQLTYSIYMIHPFSYLSFRFVETPHRHLVRYAIRDRRYGYLFTDACSRGRWRQSFHA